VISEVEVPRPRGALHLVGNDVVDLEDPAIADSHLRPRFLDRVCAPGERALLEASSDPKVLLWSLFAAKEAAFKVISKLSGPPVFAHRRFVVARDLRTVGYGGHALHLQLTRGAGWVHAQASTDEQPTSFGVEAITEGMDPGLAARRLLLTRLGLVGFEVRREPNPGSWDGYGPPRLVSLQAARGQPRDISLSHDGRFVAFAACGATTASTSP
jgi:phosphopantetheinyl transferase (holo-ACP synthase)